MYVALLFVWISLLSCSLIRLSCAAPEPHSNSVDTGFVSGESSPKTATSAARGSAEIAPSGRRRDPVTGDEYGAMYGNSPDGQPGTPGGLTGIGGTLWCGVGNLAVDASQLGASAAADACCRQHDHCAYTIPAFSRRYGLFNFGAETMSHCACDAEYAKRTNFTTFCMYSYCIRNFQILFDLSNKGVE